MDSLLNSLDNLEQATNEVQQIANDDAQARAEMEAMMTAVFAVISEIQRSLDELEDLKDAAEDVAKLKGKIEQNNQKQAELLKKLNALKETLQKSPSIRDLQKVLQDLKSNLQDNILNHKRFGKNSNAPVVTEGPRAVSVGSMPFGMRNSESNRSNSNNSALTTGGYSYIGNSPGKIISAKTRTKTKNIKKTKKTRRRRRM